jgi:hypothetical protein
MKNCLLETSAEGLPAAPGPLEKLNAGAGLLTTGGIGVDDDDAACPKENMLDLLASPDGVVVPNEKALFSPAFSTGAAGGCPKENPLVFTDGGLKIGFGGSDEGAWFAGVPKKFG